MQTKPVPPHQGRPDSVPPRCGNTLVRPARAVGLLVALVAAGTALAGAVATSAVRDTAISLERCLAAATGRPVDGAACPGFLIGALRDAYAECVAAGGRLQPNRPANVWRLDVNRDGRDEWRFDRSSDVSCVGAWSLFECGSLGCPQTLFQRRGDGWAVIGTIATRAPQTIRALAAPADVYAELEVGCASEPCDEHRYYRWYETEYRTEYLMVRGYRVDFVRSVHGLYGLTGPIDVLATPTPKATVVGHYDADTDVAIIGTTTIGDYYYVSPCNACASGFVPVAKVRVPSR
jgi:hypothetical protein